ncbi:galanin peptides-like [Brachyhypopomus gauderio]|uniref:galanin peptides-like n=1 Tax=Brachyhypopomus gauderio TaxID=698409 RepID=UPI0040430CFB
MQMSGLLLCVCLCVLSVQLRTQGMSLTGLEKRGWTLNSAGYLLGPYAHRTLMVRHGSAVSKRSRWDEPSILPAHQRSYNESYLHSLLELLMYIRMKENRMTEDFNSSIFNDNITQ